MELLAAEQLDPEKCTVQQLRETVIALIVLNTGDRPSDVAQLRDTSSPADDFNSCVLRYFPCKGDKIGANQQGAVAKNRDSVSLDCSGVPVPINLARLLWCYQNRTKSVRAAGNSNGHLFLSLTAQKGRLGTEIGADTVTRDLRGFLQRVGAPVSDPSALRAATASTMVGHGILSENGAATLLHHSGPAITKKHYLKPLRDTDEHRTEVGSAFKRLWKQHVAITRSFD